MSCVANGSDAVKPETRQRVEAAMERLGYRRIMRPGAQKHGRFQDIGVVMFNTATFGNARILDSIVANAADDDYSVTIRPCATVRNARFPPPSIAYAASAGGWCHRSAGGTHLRFRRIQASANFQSCSSANPPPTTAPPLTRRPVWLLDRYRRLPDEQGHKTVYHFAGIVHLARRRSRARGWREALEQMGARVPSMYIGDWCADSGYQAGVALAYDPDCTAIYAANDQMAYGAMLGLQSAGKRVPEDVSIVGVDDSLVDMVPRFEPDDHAKLRF